VPQADDSALLRMLAAFCTLLGLSVAFGLCGRAVVHAHAGLSPRGLLCGIALLEAIDTIVVVVALCLVPVRFRRRPPPPLRRVVVWASFVLVLAVVFGVNCLYHAGLQRVVGVASWDRAMFARRDLWPLVVVLMCVQPAIVEELFFRYLALDTLRKVAGAGTAVVLSAVMFATAHIGVPLSMPVLLVLGVALGYAREASGGLALPMLMHLLHNAAVMWLKVQAAS
jgi:membrane protease YdiL (CAAX protease family)